VLFEISEGDDQLADVKSPSACALFLAKNATAAFSAAMIAFNYVDPTSSEQRLGSGEVFPAYRRVIQDDAPGHPVCPGGEKPMHKLGPWPGTFFM